ncbi:myelin-associated glycoprotein-like isoform X2 [Clupea harengus]|uniref:Myelin-associated glycoprotein-like isoform X2 n=1 Tax=Clupea harengus TaxID=7950 RepID=A0A8M1KTZ5_CLUHA|nr:myelin-associated glycoprotein-like isoform X2 [Clupea harengus]
MFTIQGCLCTEWSIKMPGNITAVSGSCIVIPCTFTLPAKYNAKLNNSTVLWSRGLIGGPTVLSSNKQLASDFGGEIVGDFKSKNCTTVFTNLPQGFSEPLLFRVEGPNEVKYTYSKELFISFQRGSLPPPELSMSPPGELRAGKTLTLTCRARDPCPSLPPEVKIDPEMGSSQVESFLQVDSEQGVRFVTATQSFMMKPIHHGRNVTCQAIYPRRDGGKSYGEVESLTLNILYGPHNTRVMMSLPSPVPVGKLVTLRCHSEANPAVTSYNWWTENKGHLVLRATGQELVLMATWADKGLYACEATNPYGQEKSAVVALEVEGGSFSMAMPFCGIHPCSTGIYVAGNIFEVHIGDIVYNYVYSSYPKCWLR